MCKAADILHGSVFPKEVIDGSTVTVTCNTGYVVEGEWLLECQNGTLNGGKYSKCVEINIGEKECYLAKK